MPANPTHTLEKVPATPLDKAAPKPQVATILHKHYLSTMLYPTTDLAAGSYSDPHGPSQKAPVFIGDIIRKRVGAHDLLNLRLVNKAVKSWIEGDTYEFYSKNFNSLHINRRFRHRTDMQLSLKALKAVARYCSHLSIHLDSMLDPLAPATYDPDVVFDEVWMQVFTALKQLSTLSISAPGVPDWHIFGFGEALLESIRVALETTLPTGLHDITLSPINATGLLHFRWRGLAFKLSTWMAEAFWSRLAILTIGLHNPLPYYNEPNQKDFIKTLHDHLDSFSPSLGVFRFSWIGPAGPNPLLLDLHYGGHNFSAPAIRWSSLTAVHLKNVLAHPRDHEALEARCRKLDVLELGDIQMVDEGESMAYDDIADLMHYDEDGCDLEYENSREGSPFLFPFSLE